MRCALVVVLGAVLGLAPVVAGAHTGHDHGPKKSSKKVKKKPKQTQRAVTYTVLAAWPPGRAAAAPGHEKIRKST